MDKYILSNEGRSRFKRMKISVDTGMAKIEGYEILDYLYEHGASTAEEIENYTGLSWRQLMAKLSTFIHHGLVEGIN